MITVKDVLKSINMRLKSVFPDIVIQSTDVREGYARPCFYPQVLDLTTENLMNAYDKKMVVLNILYFPSDPSQNQIEILDIREKLQGVFLDSLSVNDTFTIHVLDLSDSIVDGVLSVDIEVEYYIKRSEKDYPLMEQFEIDNL